MALLNNQMVTWSSSKITQNSNGTSTSGQIETNVTKGYNPAEAPNHPTPSPQRSLNQTSILTYPYLSNFMIHHNRNTNDLFHLLQFQEIQW